MMRSLRWLGASRTLVIVVALLAGMPPVPGGSALAADPFDGTYSGITKRGANSNPNCAADGSRVQLTVIDSKVSYDHFGMILTGTVTPDGMFSASGTNTRYKPPVRQSISGHISGTGAEADTWASNCAYHVTFRKR